MKYQTTTEIELELSLYFDYRRNLVIPNVSWGFNIHECDLLVLTGSNYLYEVEIKVSKSDLVKDGKKRHGHIDRRNRIRKLYFAIPSKLARYIEYIPMRAGIIVVTTKGRCYLIKKPLINKDAVKITADDRYTLARLGALRIWKLKRKLLKLKSEEK